VNVSEVGAYIRSQRLQERLSLRKVSGLAGVSIPYLSQVERGLRKPSADILHAIAKALRISAGTLYVRAGILEATPVPDVASAIMADPIITERQKQALVQIYQAFRDEAGRDLRSIPAEAGPIGAGLVVKGPAEPAVRSRARTAASARQNPSAARGSERKARAVGTHGGGAKSQAGNSPHPAPLRSSATNRRKEV
jgi:transcriptional regulator with XRE-family HTH domain